MYIRYILNNINVTVHNYVCCHYNCVGNSATDVCTAPPVCADNLDAVMKHLCLEKEYEATQVSNGSHFNIHEKT